MSAAKVVPSATSADAGAPLPAGVRSELIADQNGRLIVNLAAVLGVSVAPVTPGVLPVEVTAPAWIKTAILPLGANGDVVVAPAGVRRLQYISITIYSGNGYLYLCDKAALAPTAASRAINPIPFNVAVGASPAYIERDFDTVGGLDMALGIVVGISTTGAVFTALAGATGDVVAWYL